MIADCPGCASDGADVREPRRARARLPWLAFLPAILYALAPKCPMCIVAYLSAFGVTFGMASLALSVFGALAVALVVLALGFALWRAKVPSFRGRARRDTAEGGSSSAADASASSVSEREGAQVQVFSRGVPGADRCGLSRRPNLSAFEL